MLRGLGVLDQVVWVPGLMAGAQLCSAGGGPWPGWNSAPLYARHVLRPILDFSLGCWQGRCRPVFFRGVLVLSLLDRFLRRPGARSGQLRLWASASSGSLVSSSYQVIKSYLNKGGNWLNKMSQPLDK